jgi:hypothetical protein
MRNFQADLKRGQQGEQDFLKLFTKLAGTDGRKGDIVAPDGKIELKTDFYPMTQTPNFFIERYSSVEVLSPGGPYQAQKHGCKYFVYYYTTAGYGYVFETDDLVRQLEKLESSLKPVEVRNKKWTTIGYKVPRELLKPIAVFNSMDCTDSIAEAWGFVAK